MNKRAAFIINIVGFNAVWFASVLGAAHGLPWAGAAGLLVFAAWQLAASHDRRYDIAALVIMGAGGLVLDSLHLWAGTMTYMAPWPWANAAPAWLVVMWLNLALTLNHSLGWLRGRYALSAAMGAVAGPLAYLAGARLGAVSIELELIPAAAVLGLTWAVALPSAYALLEVIDDTLPAGKKVRAAL